MKVFDLFVSKYPPGNDLRKPTAETLEQFQGKVPAELLNFWQEYGFGNYGGGLLKIIEQVQRLMADPALSWRDAVKQFLYACCYGEKNGIAVLTIEEQQLIFKRLSKESYQIFRQKQLRLFGEILENFGIKADAARINLFTNLSLTAMVVRKAIPDTLPLFVPEVADETVDFQINAIVDALEKLKATPTA